MNAWTGVLGTWAERLVRERQWIYPGGLFARFMRSQGFAYARPDRPFHGFSGDIDGGPLIANGRAWEAGADAFIDWCIAMRFVDITFASDGTIHVVRELEKLRIVAHSHGGQLLFIAAAAGLPIHRLILVGTPVRKEMERDVIPKALPNIGGVMHISDAWFDRMAFLGGLFDKRVSFTRTFRDPRIRTVQFSGIGHSGMFDEAHLGKWIQCRDAKTRQLVRPLDFLGE